MDALLQKAKEALSHKEKQPQTRLQVQKVKPTIQHVDITKNHRKQQEQFIPTKLTDEVKNDLLILRSREALDPKRHYKRSVVKETTQIQIGHFVGEKKQSMVNALLKDDTTRDYLRSKQVQIHHERSDVIRYKKKRRNKRN
ncbi:hypothetical protein EDD86DRAFT_199732 [Gorgonomyces haynaldii]|nr:hypothetical protein EDD86DRAFT_199732 [Gorgonomyces haynaldii]